MDAKNTSGLYGVYVLSQVVGLLSIILSFYWVLTYNGGLGFGHKTLFNWHPIFLTFGMVFLLGNGIMMFRIWRDSPRKSLKLVHFGLNALGLVCVLLGAVAVIAYKFQVDELQFFSLHSWVGFLGILLYLVQAVISIGALLFNCVSDEAKATLLPFHTFLGHLVFILGIMSIISGYNEAASKFLPGYGEVFRWSGTIANFIGVLCALYGVLVVLITSQPRYKRQLLPEDSALLGRN